VVIDANAKTPLNQMLYSTDALAKSFYSAISADLGRINKPNILTNETTLQHFTSNYSSIVFGLLSAGPATASYDAMKAVTGKPQITSSTIFATYLCQTPKPKLTSALLISVLLANLVLLRALWSILNIFATYLAKAKNLKGECTLAV
jgi:hypothetical protein